MSGIVLAQFGEAQRGFQKMRAHLLGGVLLLALNTTVQAERIANPIADFSGLDKITGRITTFSVDIDELVQFGTLRMRTRACYTRPLTEAPQTDAFVEVQLTDLMEVQSSPVATYLHDEGVDLF